MDLYGRCMSSLEDVYPAECTNVDPNLSCAFAEVINEKRNVAKHCSEMTNMELRLTSLIENYAENNSTMLFERLRIRESVVKDVDQDIRRMGGLRSYAIEARKMIQRELRCIPVEKSYRDWYLASHNTKILELRKRRNEYLGSLRSCIENRNHLYAISTFNLWNSLQRTVEKATRLQIPQEVSEEFLSQQNKFDKLRKKCIAQLLKGLDRTILKAQGLPVSSSERHLKHYINCINSLGISELGYHNVLQCVQSHVEDLLSSFLPDIKTCLSTSDCSGDFLSFPWTKLQSVLTRCFSRTLVFLNNVCMFHDIFIEIALPHFRIGSNKYAREGHVGLRYDSSCPQYKPIGLSFDGEESNSHVSQLKPTEMRCSEPSIVNIELRKALQKEIGREMEDNASNHDKHDPHIISILRRLVDFLDEYDSYHQAETLDIDVDSSYLLSNAYPVFHSAAPYAQLESVIKRLSSEEVHHESQFIDESNVLRKPYEAPLAILRNATSVATNDLVRAKQFQLRSLLLEAQQKCITLIQGLADAPIYGTCRSKDLEKGKNVTCVETRTATDASDLSETTYNVDASFGTLRKELANIHVDMIPNFLISSKTLSMLEETGIEKNSVTSTSKQSRCEKDAFLDAPNKLCVTSHMTLPYIYLPLAQFSTKLNGLISKYARLSEPIVPHETTFSSFLSQSRVTILKQTLPSMYAHILQRLKIALDHNAEDFSIRNVKILRFQVPEDNNNPLFLLGGTDYVLDQSSCELVRIQNYCLELALQIPFCFSVMCKILFSLYTVWIDYLCGVLRSKVREVGLPRSLFLELSSEHNDEHGGHPDDESVLKVFLLNVLGQNSRKCGTEYTQLPLSTVHILLRFTFSIGLMDNALRNIEMAGTNEILLSRGQESNLELTDLCALTSRSVLTAESTSEKSFCHLYKRMRRIKRFCLAVLALDLRLFAFHVLVSSQHWTCALLRSEIGPRCQSMLHILLPQQIDLILLDFHEYVLELFSNTYSGSGVIPVSMNSQGHFLYSLIHRKQLSSTLLDVVSHTFPSSSKRIIFGN